MAKKKVTFREKVVSMAPRPSDAIRLAVKGWKQYWDDPNFYVAMDAYTGTAVRDGKVICAGCLATCAVQRVIGKLCWIKEQSLLSDKIGLVMPSEKVSDMLGGSDDGLCSFEIAIDRLRTGCIGNLLDFYSVKELTVGKVKSDARIRRMCKVLRDCPINLDEVLMDRVGNFRKNSWTRQMARLNKLADLLAKHGV